MPFGRTVFSVVRHMYDANYLKNSTRNHFSGASMFLQLQFMVPIIGSSARAGTKKVFEIRAIFFSSTSSDACVLVELLLLLAALAAAAAPPAVAESEAAAGTSITNG